jgi:putative membrane protein
MMNNRSLPDSKYVQQHLANERTFLSWLRTSIAIAGLGFIAAGVVFHTTRFGHIGHWLSAVVGIGAVVLANLLIAFAAKDYEAKRRGINGDSFVAASFIVKFTWISLSVVNAGVAALVVLLLLY